MMGNKAVFCPEVLIYKRLQMWLKSVLYAPVTVKLTSGELLLSIAAFLFLSNRLNEWFLLQYNTLYWFNPAW